MTRLVKLQKLQKLLILLTLSLLSAQSSWAAAIEHGGWDRLLKANVRVIDGGQATQLDYAGMAQQHAPLNAYLQRLSKVSRAEFDQWPHPEQLAFLINAYNAWTVELILRAWPDIESIKEQGSLFSSPWSKAFIPLLGETLSLDEVEHNLIRGSGRYQEPRIHFAVNCASIGCPALRAEAYRGATLDAQLEAQTRLFLADRSRNRLRDGELQLSAIFDWYGEDFASGWQGTASLAQFLGRYADALGLSAFEQQQLLAGQLDVAFLDYDWRLNATVRAVN
ncbi:MAG: hypothetical protein ACJAWL_001283 [Motiliproteus sp.]|jgi:hypothetical protein